jgi:hypothetical protein
MIIYCIKTSFVFNYIWVVSMKQNIKLHTQNPSTYVFLVSYKNYVNKSCLSILWTSISTQNVMVSHWLVQVNHPPQKFERSSLWDIWSYGIRNRELVSSSLACPSYCNVLGVLFTMELYCTPKVNTLQLNTVGNSWNTRTRTTRTVSEHQLL